MHTINLENMCGTKLFEFQRKMMWSYIFFFQIYEFW